MKITMTAFPGHEKGNTFVGFLLKITMYGFLVLLILRIGPIYLEHYKIIESLESLKSDQDLASRSREEIMVMLQKRWDVNGVDTVTKENVTITKDLDGVSVRVAYDASQHIMGNIDVVATFDDVIEVENH